MIHPKRKQGTKENYLDIEDLSFVDFSQYIFLYYQLISVGDHKLNSSKKRPFKRTASQSGAYKENNHIIKNRNIAAK
jgi:hypothetical protein